MEAKLTSVHLYPKQIFCNLSTKVEVEFSECIFDGKVDIELLNAPDGIMLLQGKSVSVVSGTINLDLIVDPFISSKFDF